MAGRIDQIYWTRLLRFQHTMASQGEPAWMTAGTPATDDNPFEQAQPTAKKGAGGNLLGNGVNFIGDTVKQLGEFFNSVGR